MQLLRVMVCTQSTPITYLNRNHSLLCPSNCWWNIHSWQFLWINILTHRYWQENDYQQFAFNAIRDWTLDLIAIKSTLFTSNTSIYTLTNKQINNQELKNAAGLVWWYRPVNFDQQQQTIDHFLNDDSGYVPLLNNLSYMKRRLAKCCLIL